VNPLLEQFLSESREALQNIAEKLMQLEKEPTSVDLVTELFRFVHTLKGNSGLFELPELTRVIHAGEDLMDAVRSGRVAYSSILADRLLDAMDFIGILCDEIESHERIDARHGSDSVRLAEALRQLIVSTPPETAPALPSEVAATANETEKISLPLELIPETARLAAYRSALQGNILHWLAYRPVEDCFFQGDDPFYQSRQTPGILWVSIAARSELPKLADLDPYNCLLDFTILSCAPREELDEYYRYLREQIHLTALQPHALIIPQGDPNGGPVYEDFVADALLLLQTGNSEGLVRAARSMLELSNPDLWFSSALRWLLLVIECEPANHAAQEVILTSLRTLTPLVWENPAAPATIAAPAPVVATVTETTALTPATTVAQEMPPEIMAIVAVQRDILTMPLDVNWSGRCKGAVAALSGCLRAFGAAAAVAGLEQALQDSLADKSAEPLLEWLDNFFAASAAQPQTEQTEATDPLQSAALQEVQTDAPVTTTAQADADVKFGRRTEDNFSGPKSIKVDQTKIDRLMNLIGEMVVAKNALPYLAGRAENVYGVRDLSREIKSQYAVINRIAEEMQDSIMQVRMMPVSFVFQRFPRLVRDTSNKLGKEVRLVLEGEDTEADKNIIESLGEPLVHIVRNSLDHGLEMPEVRRALGKPTVGTLTIRASQESDRVVIEIRDDGKGIDPEVIKHKAYEKGVISEEQLERISDQEAVNLVFAAGFSTAEVISDLSGRGVGMDVVRTAVEKVNGTIRLESEKGKGTCISISLPLSMAVSNVMIIESNNQIFGVPMESVVETVRIPRSDIRSIKKSQTTVLRNRIVPLKPLNTMLGIAAPQKANEEDKLAVLIANVFGEHVGILVDDFHETVDIILKPMTGVLAGLSAYSGSALLGDGSVLMVLDIKEII